MSAAVNRGRFKTINDLPEWTKFESLDEGESHPLLTARGGGSGMVVEPTRAASRSEVGDEGVCTSLGEDRGSDEAGGKGGEPDRDPLRSTVEIGCVHGTHENEHGRQESVESADGGWGGREPTAKAKDGMGRLGNGEIRNARGNRSGSWLEFRLF